MTIQQPKYSEETIYQLWHNEDGERYEVGPDPDGLNLVEVRLVESDGKRVRLTLPDEVVDFLVRVLPKAKDDCIRARDL